MIGNDSSSLSLGRDETGIRGAERVAKNTLNLISGALICALFLIVVLFLLLLALGHTVVKASHDFHVFITLTGALAKIWTLVCVVIWDS